MANTRVFQIIFQAIDKAGQTINQINGQLQQTKISAIEVGTAFTAIGAALVAPFAAGIKSAATLEDQLARVQGIFGATASQADRLKQSAEDMGKATRYTALQAAEALQYMGMAGLSVNAAIEALPATLQLAQAGMLDLGQAADITTNIMTAYRMEASDLTRINDIMVAAFTGSNTSLQELAEAFKYVAPVAKGVGVEMTDLVGTLGILANNGIKASMAGTALRGTLGALFDPTNEEKKLLEELSMRIGGVGLQVKNSEGQFVGFANLLKQLEKAGLSADEALNLFGLRAGPSMAALLGTGSSALDALTDRLEKSEGRAKAMSDLMENTLTGAVEKFLSAVEALLITLGDTFLPTLTELTNKLIEFVDGLNELRDTLGPLTPEIDKTIASIGGLLLGLGSLILAYKALIAPIIGVIAAVAKWSAVSGVLSVISGTMALLLASVAALLGPIGAVTAAIIGLGAAAYKLWNLIDAIKELSAQNARLKETQKALDESLGKIDKMIQKARKETGLYIADLGDLHAQMKAGKIIYDEAAQKFEKVGAAAEEAAKREKKATIEATKAIIDSYDFRTKSAELATKNQLLTQDKLYAEGKISFQKAEEAKTEISISALAEQQKRATEYFNAAASIYSKDSKEYRDALLEKETADSKYLEGVVRKTSDAIEKAKELNRAQKEFDLSSSLEELRTQFEALEIIYAQGLKVTSEYYAERKRISEEAYEAEKNNIEGLIKTANSEVEQIQYRNQLNQLEARYRREVIQTEAEQIQTEKELGNTRKELDKIIEDSLETQKKITDKGISDIDSAYRDEFKNIEDRYDEEIDRLQSMTVAKELEAEKQIAIKELQTAKEAELEEALFEKEKQLHEQRLDIAEQSASSLEGIFENLYEISGEHISAFFYLSKAAAVAEAIINAELASTKALAEYGPAGIALAALIKAQGYTSAALIAAQTLDQSLAEGGKVGGYSPNKKADNIQANVTAGEFVQPVASAEYYGDIIMEALRKRAIPREVLQMAMSTPSANRGMLKLALANGGPVSAGGTNNSISVSVPLSVSTMANSVTRSLQKAIEETVLSVLQKELK